jgi:rod shape-determining protein MreC
MLRRTHYIAFCLVAVLTLLSLSLPSRASTQLKQAVGALFIPLFGLAASAESLARRAQYNLLPKQELISQLEHLARENEQLRLQLLQQSSLEEENLALRQSLGWQKQTRWNLKAARVIGRDPASWWRTAQIDLGSRDGLTTNMAVLTPEGFVGRIGQVSYTTAQVVLIGDPNCRVSALVEGTQETGFISGAASVLDRTLVSLTALDRQSQLQPGQRVVTSHLGIYKKGIPIGHVVDAQSVGFGLYNEARVRLAADLRHLEHVWVMVQ